MVRFILGIKLATLFALNVFAMEESKSKDPLCLIDIIDLDKLLFDQEQNAADMSNISGEDAKHAYWGKNSVINFLYLPDEIFKNISKNWRSDAIACTTDNFMSAEQFLYILLVNLYNNKYDYTSAISNAFTVNFIVDNKLLKQDIYKKHKNIFALKNKLLTKFDELLTAYNNLAFYLKFAHLTCKGGISSVHQCWEENDWIHNFVYSSNAVQTKSNLGGFSHDAKKILRRIRLKLASHKKYWNGWVILTLMPEDAETLFSCISTHKFKEHFPSVTMPAEVIVKDFDSSQF